MAASIFEFFFDNDYKQRRDIEELRDQASKLQTRGGSARGETFKLEQQIHELRATVQVLVNALVERGDLTLEDLKTKLHAELKGSPKPVVEVKCSRCGEKGPSNTMVKVGADYWCRPCAKNP